jgi:hypothetical protein
LAEEGMWIPILLEKYTIEQMHELGFKLSPEDIYSVNKACLKDAVVLFGNGCTGSFISDKGLLITNHHCGYKAIQSHSTITHNYLKDGFWAKKPNDELSNPGLTITILKKMEDVTNEILKGVTDSISEKEREKIISLNTQQIINQTTKNTHYSAQIKPFFQENQYFLFLNEVFTDVRLVGTPPSEIGKFGGDTDNWIWPRHTGDFSLFRVYASKENKPNSHNKDNIPYKPIVHFPISLKGYYENDFTMILGFPGSTKQYVPSYHIKMITEKINPTLIDIRTKKLEIIKKNQKENPKIRIQYAVKYAHISNSWKKWKGEIKGLQKNNAIEKKEEYENLFRNWIKQNNIKKYDQLLNNYQSLYKSYSQIEYTKKHFNEVLFTNGMEMVNASSNLLLLNQLFDNDTIDEKRIKYVKAFIKNRFRKFYKDFHQPLDKEITHMLMYAYRSNISDNYIPNVYHLIDRNYKGNLNIYINQLFKKSLAADSSRLYHFIDEYSEKKSKKLDNDPALSLFKSFYSVYKNKVYPLHKILTTQLDSLHRIYMAAQIKHKPDTPLYPDANLTFRIAYGQIKKYDPFDGVTYKYNTSIDGIIEKDNPLIYDYKVPEKLKNLYNLKDFGNYEANGSVPVCFIATNHTTGGNSGSPVLNANGELIGVNFDRVWEGVMSDLMYTPNACRNISLDIRYALFIIDKYAEAKYLLDEMTIIQ